MEVQGKNFQLSTANFQLFIIFAPRNSITMKKELGKWLMDVAKYSVTAGLLSYWFKGMEGWNSPSYFVAIGFIMIVLTIGLILVRDDKMAKKTNRGQQNNNSKKKRR